MFSSLPMYLHLERRRTLSPVKPTSRFFMSSGTFPSWGRWGEESLIWYQGHWEACLHILSSFLFMEINATGRKSAPAVVRPPPRRLWLTSERSFPNCVAFVFFFFLTVLYCMKAIIKRMQIIRQPSSENLSIHATIRAYWLHCLCLLREGTSRHTQRRCSILWRLWELRVFRKREI